ncbi:MerR family transcriptional regulator [Paenibacillus psychroresistens]|uniref:MerR family transcriptional regulator n=1 Tax=Paenibacillus psychroresistens TaxID=1778678 RepID=A0A6B8RPR7_9BACL|nr:MerR family transcriptional regulator [Paenibacillus psychroresistens]QGQ97525.1 MerR family transcriptional regulator [Paenibacillus psychroresistens]
MKKTWKVGELAKLTGLTIRTLRYYDQIGLFCPTGFSDSGHRLYYDSDIARLHQILALKELNLSLEEIKLVLLGQNYNPIEVVSQQIRRIKDNILSQQKLLGELEYVLSLMNIRETISVEEFTKLLQLMKKSPEKFFAERKLNWEKSLDQLGEFLNESPKRQPIKEE